MTVVIGYIPNQYGEAALQLGLQEAETRQMRVIVVNASRGDAYVDKRFVNEQALTDLDERLTAAGVDHRVHQAVESTSATRSSGSRRPTTRSSSSSASALARRSARY